jgi:acyl-CoA thioesterase I
MHRRAFVLGWFITAAALVAGCRRGRALPKLDPGATIVAFGDSLTYGTGASEGESYPAVLERLIGRRVIRAGVPGEVSGDALQRLPQVLDEHQPQLLLLCIGGNDLLRKINETTLASNVRQMIGIARDRGIAVVLIGVPRPALLSSVPELYAQLASEAKIPIEADVLKNVLFDNSLKSDPIHPNAKGYERVAEAVARLLKSEGAL